MSSVHSFDDTKKKSDRSPDRVQKLCLRPAAVKTPKIPPSTNARKLTTVTYCILLPPEFLPTLLRLERGGGKGFR